MARILVIGDSCKDVHVYGSCKRLAPDSPVPVFVPTEEKHNDGMAGNVYRNIISLGGNADLQTNTALTEKKRYVEKKTNHMFIRVDSGQESVTRIKNLSKSLLDPYELVVVSDYNKGFLTQCDIEFICRNHSLVFIDSKKKIGDFCEECSFLKINKDEYEQSQEYLDTAPWCKEKLLVTLSSHGCRFKDKMYPVENVEIKDLCGAGDSFLAALCVKYLENQSIEESIVFGNECATQVVQQRGVNVVKMS
jgi:D-beta-D-heptose 7-phosphate kinase/D-beta-D-heptose 1-phosphate adenosyltransferase